MSKTCSIDRTELTIDALKPAPRILRNLLSRYLVILIYFEHLQTDLKDLRQEGFYNSFFFLLFLLQPMLKKTVNE